MSYFAVIVTYGDRFKYLKQVIDSLLEQNIDKIIIVSNGSVENTLEHIRELKRKFDCIELIDLEKNTGSANGFSKGIEVAFNQNADFIWLLDDDNKPEKNALFELKIEWENLAKETPFDNLALLSYRDDRDVFKKAIDFDKPKLMLGPNNSFLGFDLLSKIKNIFFIKTNSEINEKEKGIVLVAPYGGLFFNRNLIAKIGFPDKSFFLYSDDYEFSYRISKNKGKIFLISKSKITDLEKSFHLIKSKRIINTRYFNTNSRDLIYYSVRNNVFFEQNFVTNKTQYYFNRYSYFFLLFLIMTMRPKHFWKFSLIIKAVRESRKFKRND